MRLRVLHVYRQSKRRGYLSKFSASLYFWLGATDQFRSDKKWYWVQTEQNIKTGYSDWYRTEPDNPGKQHCLAMRKDFHYQWSNDYCNQMFGYICERPLLLLTSAQL